MNLSSPPQRDRFQILLSRLNTHMRTQHMLIANLIRMAVVNPIDRQRVRSKRTQILSLEVNIQLAGR